MGYRRLLRSVVKTISVLAKFRTNESELKRLEKAIKSEGKLGKGARTIQYPVKLR